MTDTVRIERAARLFAQPLGDGVYRVTGGADKHRVDMKAAGGPRCDCGDHTWRQVECKHILAVRIVEGDAEVLAAALDYVRTLTN